MTDHTSGLTRSIYLSDKDNLLAILSVLDALPMLAMLLSRDGQYIDVFGADDSLLAREVDFIKGKFIRDLFDKDKADAFCSVIEKAIDSNTTQTLQYELEVQSGVKLFEGRVTPLPIEQDNKLVIWFARDITDEKRQLESIEYFAYHDPLTGAANRMRFYQRLEEENSRCERHNLFSALVFIDLDDFKEINDEHGHMIGDEVLVNVVDRLKSHTREEDLVCRQGGDEFVLILSLIGTDTITAIDHSARITTNLKQTISAPLVIEDKIIQVTASYGLSVLPKKGKSAQEILRQADEAMFESKNRGKNVITTFE